LQGAQGAQGVSGAQGAVRQIVYGSSSTEVIADTAAYEDIGVSATITPGATANTILVFVSLSFYGTRSTSSVGFGVQIRRGATVVYETLETTVPMGFFQNAGSATSITSAGNYALSFRDSPASISALTYSVWARVSNTASSGQVAFQKNDTIDGSSSITLIEVA
jgi:hypothetical protein